MSSLAGKKAIVTGAGHAQGIGHAVALKLAREGADVAVVDLASAAEGLGEVVGAMGELGRKGVALTADVRVPAEVDAAARSAEEELGSIDILVNNAGIGIGSAEFLEVSEEDWMLTLEVNLLGAMRFMRAVLPGMRERQSGAIVNVASLCGLRHIPATPTPYTASKFALVGLTKAIASEFGAQGIRCNAVCPGSVDTQLREKVLELISGESDMTRAEADAEERTTIALGRPADPAEIAETVAFLAGPAGSYVTGAALVVDGGMEIGL